MPRGSPRTYEVDVDGLDPDELEERLRTAGQSAHLTRTIVGYVVQLQMGRDLDLPRATDSRYRRLICEAYGIPPGPPPRNARPRPDVVTKLRPAAAGERGAAKVRHLVAVAGVGAVALFAGHSAADAARSAPEAPRSPSPAFERPAPIIPVSRRSRGSEGRRAA